MPIVFNSGFEIGWGSDGLIFDENIKSCWVLNCQNLVYVYYHQVHFLKRWKKCVGQSNVVFFFLIGNFFFRLTWLWKNTATKINFCHVSVENSCKIWISFFFQAEKKYLKTYNIKEHQSSYGILHTSTLGLRFRVAKKHFQPDGDMKLKCKASIGKIFALKR